MTIDQDAGTVREGIKYGPNHNRGKADAALDRILAHDIRTARITELEGGLRRIDRHPETNWVARDIARSLLESTALLQAGHPPSKGAVMSDYSLKSLDEEHQLRVKAQAEVEKRDQRLAVQAENLREVVRSYDTKYGALVEATRKCIVITETLWEHSGEMANDMALIQDTLTAALREVEEK